MGKTRQLSGPRIRHLWNWMYKIFNLVKFRRHFENWRCYKKSFAQPRNWFLHPKNMFCGRPWNWSRGIEKSLRLWFFKNSKQAERPILSHDKPEKKCKIFELLWQLSEVREQFLPQDPFPRFLDGFWRWQINCHFSVWIHEHQRRVVRRQNGFNLWRQMIDWRFLSVAMMLQFLDRRLKDERIDWN